MAWSGRSCFATPLPRLLSQGFFSQVHHMHRLRGSADPLRQECVMWHGLLQRLQVLLVRNPALHCCQGPWLSSACVS